MAGGVRRAPAAIAASSGSANGPDLLREPASPVTMLLYRALADVSDARPPSGPERASETGLPLAPSAMPLAETSGPRRHVHTRTGRSNLQSAIPSQPARRACIERVRDR